MSDQGGECTAGHVHPSVCRNARHISRMCMGACLGGPAVQPIEQLALQTDRVAAASRRRAGTPASSCRAR
eukprot:scaffold181178_cov18-Tisochrysis_lutea.AAC.3